MFKKIFIAGCLVWLPIIATIWVIKFVVELLDELLGFFPKAYQPDYLFGMHIPGFGVLLAVIVVVATGSLVTNFFGNKMMSWWDAGMKKVPLVGGIYSAVKQVLQTLVSSDGESFRKVLLVQYPREGTWSIAFQTGETSEILEKAVGEDMVNVFIPTTPNPTSGFLLMVPKNQVKELDMSVEEAFKLVVSLGTLKSKDEV